MEAAETARMMAHDVKTIVAIPAMPQSRSLLPPETTVPKKVTKSEATVLRESAISFVPDSTSHSLRAVAGDMSTHAFRRELRSGSPHPGTFQADESGHIDSL